MSAAIKHEIYLQQALIKSIGRYHAEAVKKAMLPDALSLHALHKRLKLTMPKPQFFAHSPRSPFRGRRRKDPPASKETEMAARASDARV